MFRKILELRQRHRSFRFNVGKNSVGNRVFGSIILYKMFKRKSLKIRGRTQPVIYLQNNMHGALEIYIILDAYSIYKHMRVLGFTTKYIPTYFRSPKVPYDNCAVRYSPISAQSAPNVKGTRIVRRRWEEEDFESMYVLCCETQYQRKSFQHNGRHVSDSTTPGSYGHKISCVF